MAKFKTESKDFLKVKKDTKTYTIVSKAKFESFNENILGLGKIESKSEQINAISVLFDLEGFTNFCRQIDPQLAVPEYLSEFLKWLFSQVRAELTEEAFAEGYKTYSDLPFLSKFMGDGILFLFDTANMSEISIMNIVWSMYEICNKYESDFYKKIRKKVVSPPPRLRCGIARGAIYTVGDGNDFVGPCINMSARLQKLNTLTFAFSRRGLNPEGKGIETSYTRYFDTMKTDIRGIGSEELVCILKSEYGKLSKEDKAKFSNP